MKDFTGIVALQADTLVEALRAHRENRCRELLRDADRQAEALLADSRRKLLARGREAVSEERERRQAALRQASNRARTEGNLRRQQLYTEVLRDGWPLLVRELQNRWSSPGGRRAWCRKVLDEASAALPPDDWTVEHAQVWSADDERWLADELAERGVVNADILGAADCVAGLRLYRASACIDGSIEGLLRRRRRVEGRLLAAWEAAAPGLKHG